MRILFDNGTPRGSRVRYTAMSLRKPACTAGILAGTANSWTRLKQLDLSSSSPLTENIRYQQNLTGRRIAIVVLGKGSLETHQGQTARRLLRP